MSPTVFRAFGFRFSFFSNEEARIHVHVFLGKHEAKFWLEPTIELAHNNGLKPRQITRVTRLIEEHQHVNSKTLGKGISDAEVTHISIGGIWLLLDDNEYFLPFEKYPDFRDATVAQIHNFRIVNGDELEWPDLQLNLSIKSFDSPTHVPTLVEAT